MLEEALSSHLAASSQLQHLDPALIEITDCP